MVKVHIGNNVQGTRLATSVRVECCRFDAISVSGVLSVCCKIWCVLASRFDAKSVSGVLPI